MWMHVQDTSYVEVMPDVEAGAFFVQDIRNVGIDPVENWRTIAMRRREQGLSPLRYSTVRDQDLIVVIADSGDGGMRWYIDPAKGHNIVMTEVYLEGRKIGETRLDLEKMDKHWFPRRVSRLRLGDGQPLETASSRIFEIHVAEFNRPDHPRALGPADIGVEPGMDLLGAWRKFGAGDTIQTPVWDGFAPADRETFFDKVSRGVVTLGPTVIREQARRQARWALQDQAKAERSNAGAGSMADHGVRRFRTGWEKYTQSFILRYGLDSEQTEIAWRLYRECKERAEEHVKSIDEPLRRLEETLKTAPGVERSKAVEKLEHLLSPVETIFDTRLKPGLEKLPTTAQRRATADEINPVATQPVPQR